MEQPMGMEGNMDKITANDLIIPSLGPGTFWSPLHRLADPGESSGNFIEEHQRVLLDDTLEGVNQFLARNEPLPSFELAGPRRKIFFDPDKTACGIVTCGGLCPGLNDVVRGLVMQLNYRYGVHKVYGFRYGYEGFIQDYGHAVENLTPEGVRDFHRFGGTVLGTSRGPQDSGRILDRLQELGINVLFVIGGDGTLRGALDISNEAKKRKRPLAVVGIPKTIDNDIMFMDKSFGYETAFAAAVEAIQSAHTEALGSRNGVGLVKLMGRHSGFITCSAVLSTNEVNIALVPEVPFSLEGEHGLLEVLRQRIETRHHAVIVVAEGAGQDLVEHEAGGSDQSGNVKLKDIGLFLKQRIEQYFKGHSMELNLKYIDPSYIIRSVPASPQDSGYCMRLAQAAVHAAMAGKTGILVARWHGHFVHLPIPLATSGRKRVDPQGDLWQSVLESTGQPARMR
jgi:6-phosphofructokinase 1